MEIHSFAGRYPGRTRLIPGNMHGTVQETEQGLRVRLGDRENLDFWIEFTIDTRNMVHDTLTSDAIPKDFETTSGNIIGVIEEPIHLDPEKTLGEQCIVKIGVIDPVRARKKPFPKQDLNVVIQKLKHHILTVLKD